MNKEGVFIRADWKNLLMVNYEVDPALLQDLVPPKTQLDFFEGKTYVSLIGFMFYNTRVLSLRIPWHVNFEEVNLRFYVKYNHKGEWRHGVVFLNEIVKLPVLALSANFLYKEKYRSTSMRHYARKTNGAIELSYQWKHENKWNSIEATAGPVAMPLQPGTKEIFISERFWGYSKAGKNSTHMYRVEHPRWNLLQLHKEKIVCNFEENFGERFSIHDRRSPDSVFVLDGSETAILNKKTI